MHRFAQTLPIFCLLSLLQSCEPQTRLELHGQLYFASGSYIGEFDLQQGASTIAANRGAVTIRNVSAFTGGRLLLAETAIVENQEVPRISWVDLDTGQAGTLYSGVIARYLPGPGVLVWDDGTRLHASSRIRNLSHNAEIITHNLNQLTTILDVADDTVLFTAGGPTQRIIHSYNVVTKELLRRAELSNTCQLTAAVWISNRDQLACLARDTAGMGVDYLLVDLEGTIRGRLDLPQGKRFVALVYLPDQHVLIFTERWRSLLGGVERFAVWAYDMGTGQSHRLVKDQYLGASAVYFVS